MYISGPHGTAFQPIVIAAVDPSQPPIIRGGNECLKLQSPQHIELRNLIFEGANSNGLNIDDSGRNDFSAHHVKLRNLVIREVGKGGNQDGLKMSGVSDFVIEKLTVDGWSQDGQAIDLVGCRDGKVEDCFLDGKNVGRVGFQAKGGSRDILVQNCRFERVTDRSLNIGGKTGLKFFRPEPQGFEAKDVTITGCTIVGSAAPFAFVNVDGALVNNNTIFRPTHWVFRILQETRSEGFVPSRNGRFVGNVIAWRGEELSFFVNVGAETDAESFQIAENFWYRIDSPQCSQPQGLPVEEQGGVYGQDPEFRDPESGKLQLGRTRDEMRRAASKQLDEKRMRTRIQTGFVIAVLILFLLVDRRARRVGNDSTALTIFDSSMAGRTVPYLFHFYALATLWTGLIIYGSFTPATWRTDLSLAEAVEQFRSLPLTFQANRRVDWASNFLLLVPFGFLWMAIGTWQRRSLPREVLMALGTLVGGIFLGVLVEFGQLWVPSRFSSQDDVFAQFCGNVTGVFLWFMIGRWSVSRLRQLLPHVRKPEPIDIFLTLYVVGFVIWSTLPLDLTIHPVELYHKFNSGAVILIPFTGSGAEWKAMLMHSLLFFPIGLFAATVWTSPQKPVRSFRGTILLGSGFAVGLEMLQLLVRSRYVDATDVIAGMVGVALAHIVMVGWVAHSPLLSPRHANVSWLHKSRWVTVLFLSAAVLVSIWNGQRCP